MNASEIPEIIIKQQGFGSLSWNVETLVGNQTLYISRDVGEKRSKKNTDRSMSEMGDIPIYGHLSKDNDDKPNAINIPVNQPFHRT